MTRPRIAVLLDENTSGDASRYEAHKGYFDKLLERGALPFGVPFHAEMIAAAPETFDGLLVTGGRFAYPREWYVDGLSSLAPESARLPIELGLIRAFLDRDRPVLGICAGMQAMAGLAGCRLHPDVRALRSNVEHDAPGAAHPVSISGALADWAGRDLLHVNSFHREGVVEASAGVEVTARSRDGLIEGVSIPGLRFAHGVQWHPERMRGPSGELVFDRFVAASG